MGGKKRPLPEPASGDVSDAELLFSGSVMSEAASLTHMDSEDDSAAVSCWQEFVGTLVSAVRETLKIEDVAGTPPCQYLLGFSRLPRTAEVFPCVPYLDNMLYKEWDAPQKVCQKTLQPVTPLRGAF